MIDVYVDDVSLKNIENNSDGSFRLDFLNTEKDESINIVLSNTEMLNVLRRIGQRCETTGIALTVDIKIPLKKEQLERR